jgi:hypothetical protein
MSRFVTLMTSDGLAIGNTILPSDFPNTPTILIWQKRYFIGGNISFRPAPGAYETYIEADMLTLHKNALSEPDTIPTN